jgi:hypothetical protein
MKIPLAGVGNEPVARVAGARPYQNGVHSGWRKS